MSYAAEPYGQFVDDLLTALTGGVTRERFRFLPEEAPFRIAPPGPILPSTLQVFGQAGTAFRRFRADVDFGVTPDGVLQWKARADGSPAADAVWPDEGTDFFVNYDYRGPAGAVPLLSDRNSGSVTRLLAESFAREYAVLSLQLEQVYRAGFLATAGGRDLDQLVALVGVARRNPTFAIGSAVFSRASPAPADVFLPSGTRLSTAEPPVVVFETTDDRTLHRGSLSVEAPVQALTGGPTGVVAAGAISVVNRPILGIESAANLEPTRLGGATESDDALRARAARALEGAGRATPGALVAALTTLPGVREKDVRIDEDPIRRPGVITLKVAAELEPAQAARAVELIEATRPLGVRVLHELHSPATLPAISPGTPEGDDRDDAGPADATTGTTGLFYPVVATAVLLPAAPSLTPDDRTALERAGEEVIRRFVADAGIGETLVYNRLVAALMSLDGVLDVAVELYPATPPAVGPGAVDPLTVKRRRNLDVPRTLRATVDPAQSGAFNVDVGGELVALDVTVTATLRGLAAAPDLDPAVLRENVRLLLGDQLRDRVASLTTLTPAALRAVVPDTDDYTVTAISYRVEFLDAGIRVSQPDLTLTLDNRQRPWIRQVALETTP
jgi:uncharacterized phage protein gp47/JayE